MPDTNIDSTEMSDLTNVITDYSVDPISTDAGGDQKEYTWQMTEWSQNLGYYKTIPELKTAIDATAKWCVGAGFTAKPQTEIILSNVKGNGKDSFNTILKNQLVTRDIGGDSFAEIICDNDETLINLKPLDPSSIVVVQNSHGIIIRYEQATKTGRVMKIINKLVGRNVNKKFTPKQIFHLSRNRVADEIHGNPVVDSVKEIILARNEAMSDWKRVLHRNIDPLIIWHLDTDDPTEIAEQKRKTDLATSKGENLYIPKGTVVPEIVATAQNATLNPMSWIDSLNNYFFQTVNMPQIIVGSSKDFTDASAKISYLAWEQSVKGIQLYVEEQVLNQLGLQIELTFPASMQNEAISDQPNPKEMMVEEEPMEQATQPNDNMTELEGKK